MSAFEYSLLKVTATARLLSTSVVALSYYYPGLSGAAFADEDGDGQGPQGPGQGGSGQGQGGPGNRDGQGNQGGQGSGQGGPSSDSDGQGPQAGGPSGSGGGKPAWAQEGIPEVELGRLNVARSPDHVLDRAFAEALASMTPEIVAFYSLSLDDMIEQLSVNWDNLAFLDSPLQNLSLLREALDGTSSLTALGVTTTSVPLWQCSSALHPTRPCRFPLDTVIALSMILDQPLSQAEAAAIAADA